MTAKVTYAASFTLYYSYYHPRRFSNDFQYFSFNLHLRKYFSRIQNKIYLDFFSFLNSIPSIGLYSDIHPQSSLDFKTK